MSDEILKPPTFAAHFPTSTARSSRLFNFTGVTAQSTETVRRVLTENDHAYDIFQRRPMRCELPTSTSSSVRGNPLQTSRMLER